MEQSILKELLDSAKEIAVVAGEAILKVSSEGTDVVIGEARLASLSMLVDKALRRAKQIIAPIFVSEGLFLILLLALLLSF